MPTSAEPAGWIARHRMRALGLWGPACPGPAAAVGHLTAMQAQVHLYARWSIGQRSASTSAEVDAAYDAGLFLRTHALRPTLHYVAPGDLRWILALTGPGVEARIRRRYEELGLDARALARSTDVIAGAVTSGGLTRPELAEALEARGVATAGQRLPFMVMHAELHAAVCSGPMRGRRHTYAPFDARVPPGPGPGGDEARAELARRYFVTRGPATVKDFSWWSGLRAPEAGRALAAVSANLASHTYGGRTYWFADAGGGDPGPRADLVQQYDEAVISYTHTRDAGAVPGVPLGVGGQRFGFAHVVLVDGRIAGSWRVGRRRPDVQVETRLPGDLDAGQRSALEEAKVAYARFASGLPPAPGG